MVVAQFGTEHQRVVGEPAPDELLVEPPPRAVVVALAVLLAVVVLAALVEGVFALVPVGVWVVWAYA